jgi:hypothetical protein
LLLSFPLCPFREENKTGFGIRSQTTILRGKHLGSFLALGQEPFSLGKRSLPSSPMNDFQICATENFSFACAVQDLGKREESSFTPSKLHLSVKPGKFTAA